MREIITNIVKGQVTQGSVFSGLESSFGNRCYGIVITARCDIEHAKLSKIVTLPVYRLDEWMVLYGNEEIFEKSKVDIANQLDTLLIKYGLSYETFRVFGSSEVLKKLEAKSAKKQDLEKYANFTSFFNDRDFSSGIKALSDNRTKYFDALVSHSKSSAYFIEGLLGDNTEGFVIDLGEPISLQFRVINDLDKGLHYQKYNRKKETTYKNLHLNEGESAIFHSTLLSPYIEHLLQRFSQFYSRIGTDDIDSDTYTIIKETYEKR